MKYALTFYINKEKGKPDGRLRCRVSFNGQRVSFCVGHRIMIDGWNTDTQRCRRGSVHNKVHAQKINAELDRIDRKVTEIFEDAESMTPEILRSLLKDEPKEAPQLAADAIKRFIKEESARWSDATVKKFVTLGNHIGAYSPSVRISEISTRWMSSFSSYLLKELSNVSVNKTMKNVRWLLRWAKANGYTIDEDASQWSPKLKTAQRKVIFLDWDELMNVYSFDLRNLHHAEVRDVFCFCCFTGLRYSDVQGLRRSDVHGDEITVTTIKTADLIRIPLNRFAKAILDRYRDEDLKGKALPVCNNCEMNEALKEVMKICGIDEEITMTEYRGSRRVDEVFKKYELITTHCGRRTFVCNALMMGVSAEVVMTITGHSSYASMKPYVAVADRAKREAMDLFDRRNDQDGT